MSSAFLANRVRVASSTTGTGTLTLGAKTSNKYTTFAEGGITNGQVVTYCIEEGDDWEIGRGTYTSSGTTLSRDTVLISSIGGTVGTTKLTLAGAESIHICAAKEDLDVNDFTEDTAPDGAADFHWMHDTSAVLKKKVLPSNIFRTGGLQRLNFGTVSAAATLDIVLTSYTACRGLLILLSGFLPATDGVNLYCRFSTDGGAAFDATGYSWGLNLINDASGLGTVVSASANQIDLIGAAIVGNGAAEGVNGQLTMLNQTSAAFWTRISWHLQFVDNVATPGTRTSMGGGARRTAQDTDAIRFLFSSGNIAAGNWAIYGYA